MRTWLLAACASLLLTGTARADAIDDMKKKGEMVVGMEVAYVPYEFFKDGEIVGYDCEIARKIAAKIGVKASFVDTDWGGIIPALYAHKFDVIMSAMTITAERAQKVAFSMPYADASIVIFLRADESRIKSAEDLSGMTLGATVGSAGASLLQRFEAHLKSEGKPGFAEVKLYEHYPEAYIDLANHRSDAVVNSLSTLAVVMRDQPGKYKMLGGIQDLKAYFGMAFRKEDTRMLDVTNEVLAEMKKSGELDALQMKWFGTTMPTPDTVPAVLP